MSRAFVRLAMLLNHNIVNPNLEGFVFILADFETETLEVGPCEREHHFASVLCIPVNTGIAEQLERNAEVLPFSRNFTKALGAELHLEGFAVALHAVIDEHEQGVFATLGTFKPKFENTFFQIRSQVHGTGNTDCHTGIVACDKFDFHGEWR